MERRKEDEATRRLLLGLGKKDSFPIDCGRSDTRTHHHCLNSIRVVLIDLTYVGNLDVRITDERRLSIRLVMDRP
eukprot:9838630-Ditylum_brightwellii.AAC.1